MVEPAGSAQGADGEFETWWEWRNFGLELKPNERWKWLARDAWNAARDQARIEALVEQNAELLRWKERQVGDCPLHGEVMTSHRCRDYDGESRAYMRELGLYPSTLAAAQPPAEQEEW